MNTAQRAFAAGIRHHPLKDGRTWVLSTCTVTTPATPTTAAVSSTVETTIDPVIETINEYEALHLGNGLRSGDLRLILNGFTDWHESMQIRCNGADVDIRKVVQYYQYGEVQGYKIYVTRPPETQET